MQKYHNVKKATLQSSKIILEDRGVAFLRFWKFIVNIISVKKQFIANFEENLDNAKVSQLLEEESCIRMVNKKKVRSALLKEESKIQIVSQKVIRVRIVWWRKSYPHGLTKSNSDPHCLKKKVVSAWFNKKKVGSALFEEENCIRIV